MVTIPNNLHVLQIQFIEAMIANPGPFIVLAWLFVLGIVIGSFLNVVIWRLPAGVSVVHPRSACPRCKISIRAADNIPVVSWLWLRGKCRQCKTPISGRYPLVELMVGLLVLSQGIVTRLAANSGSSTAWLMSDSTANYPLAMPTETWPWMVMAFRLVFMLTLFCMMMIQHDNKFVPWRLYVTAGVVAAILPWCIGPLRPASVIAELQLAGGWQQAADSLIGFAIGVLIGWLAQPATSFIRRERMEVTVVLAFCGLFLGWQMVVAIGVITATVYLAACSFWWAISGRANHAVKPARWSLFFFIVTVYYLTFASLIAGRLPWLGCSTSLVTLLASVLYIALCSLVTQWIKRLTIGFDEGLRKNSRWAN